MTNPEALADASSALDVTALMHRLAGNQLAFVQVCNLMIEGMESRLTEMAIGAADADFEAVRQIAHNLKGSSSNFTSGPVCQLAAAMEDAAAQRNAVETDRLYHCLRRACANLVADLKAELNKPEPGHESG